MSVVEELSPELDEKHEELIVKLISDIKNGKLDRSDKLALATITVLEQIISDCIGENPLSVLYRVRVAARRLPPSPPACPAAAAAARRVLRALRQEYRAQHDTESEGAWLRKLVSGSARASLRPRADLADSLREHLQEIRVEVEGSLLGTRAALLGQVRGERVVCATARAAALLAGAGGALHNTTIVLPATGDEWQRTAATLAAGGVSVTVADSSTLYALMPRVNKVVVWALAALCGGAARGEAGARAAASIAHKHAVPVLCVSPLQQLCPQHEAQAPPARPAPPAAHIHGTCTGELPASLTPQWDYLPAELITLHVTNIGCISPSYMYRLMSELYDPNDYEL